MPNWVSVSQFRYMNHCAEENCACLSKKCEALVSMCQVGLYKAAAGCDDVLQLRKDSVP